jgi:hypothetical protein
MTPTAMKAATMEAATMEAATMEAATVEAATVEAAAVKATTTAVEAAAHATHMRCNRRSRKREGACADNAGQNGSSRQSFQSFRKFQHLRSPSFSHARASPEPPIST